MTHIIAIVNHKGGVGKTTSTVNIGAGLSKIHKKRVLIIDLDPQANATSSLGHSTDDQEIGIYHALTGRENLHIVNIESRLDIIPANILLSRAEKELSDETGREYILKELLEKFKDDYEYILIDCPPSMGVLTLNALTASTDIFIPLEPEFLSLKGLNNILRVVSLIQQRINPDTKITGVFLTRFDTRTSLHKSAENVANQHFADKVFKTKIRRNIALAEAPSFGKHIFSHDEKSIGAQDYTALTKEIIMLHKSSKK